ncbi:uncharacterized protein LOC136038229 isoform X2 [Artemia franciscana]|uniref:SH3 domain-containing protein n=1 Tax=Artemia franciscana TaxID=6661 RepID=A0AA88I5P3_ARTSF|nr:hypothetical protein QYM36_005967 [Artemia franciscana]
MTLDLTIDELLEEILNFLEVTLKNVFCPANILEEKFRISAEVSKALDKRKIIKEDAIPQEQSRATPTSSNTQRDEAILRSGHKHRNGVFLNKTEEAEQKCLAPNQSSECPETLSLSNEEVQELKRTSLNSSSSSESNITRREDDATSIRSSTSTIHIQGYGEILPTYEEAESRCVFAAALKRKVGIVPGWKTFAGILCDNKLLLYCQTKTGPPKLSISLESYEVRAASVSKKKKNYEFVIVGAGKQTYKFRTETENDLVDWIRSLENCIKSITAINLIGVTEDETSDCFVYENGISFLDEKNNETANCEIYVQNYNIVSDAKRNKEYEYERASTKQIDEQNSFLIELRDLPSLPNDLYDDIGSIASENIYDIPIKEAKEDVYDVPLSHDRSRKSSGGTMYDSFDDFIYEAPDISFDPSELYDTPRPCDMKISTISLSGKLNSEKKDEPPPLTLKNKMLKKSQIIKEPLYNIPKSLFDEDIYDKPKQQSKVAPGIQTFGKDYIETTSKLESEKSKVTRQLSFTNGSKIFKDELELKFKKLNSDTPILGKNKKEFMGQLLYDAPNEGRFMAYPAIVEPVSPTERTYHKSPKPSSTTKSSPLSEVFHNARNVFLQKTDHLKKNPAKLKLDLQFLGSINDDSDKSKSAPATPTKVVPPRPPAPNFKKDEDAVNPPLKSSPHSMEDIYEDIDSIEHTEPEIYIARWAYIATSEKEMNLRKGETVQVLNKNNGDSWFCKTSRNQGYAPSAYLAKVI